MSGEPVRRSFLGVRGGSCIFDMNNFKGTCDGNLGASVRQEVTPNLSLGVAAERNRYDLTRFAYPGVGSLTSDRLIGDVRYTFGPQSALVRPFVEAGVGFAKVNARFDVTPGTSPVPTRIPRSRDSDVMGHLAVGATVKAPAGIEIDAAATYQMTDNLRFPVCMREPGQAERCNYVNPEGKLARTTGFERNYGARVEIRIPFLTR